MSHTPDDEPQLSRVRAAFEDSALSFMLSKGATFEDLAHRLARLGKGHHSKPLAIEVELAAGVGEIRCARPTRALSLPT